MADNIPRQYGMTPLGSDFNHQEMYNQYVNQWKYFNSIGQGELADDLTLQMEQQYAVKGGTQPMLDSYQQIVDGSGTGPYSPEQYIQLTGTDPTVQNLDGTGRVGATALNAQGQPISAPASGVSAGQIANAGQAATAGVKGATDPNKDGVQKGISASTGALGTLGALGVGGVAVPVLGAGLAVGGAIYDYQKNQKAEATMAKKLREQEQIRNIASQKYNRELDNEYARRETGFRGQTQAAPLYTAAMANAGKGYANQQQTNADMLQKGGMGEKSGMLAQMASQNYGNMANAMGKATKDSLTNQQRAYGGLANLATSTSPEMNQYNMAQGQYNDTQNFGSNLTPLANMAGAYAKSKFRDAGMESMVNEYEDNKAGV